MDHCKQVTQKVIIDICYYDEYRLMSMCSNFLNERTPYKKKTRWKMNFNQSVPRDATKKMGK